MSKDKVVRIDNIELAKLAKKILELAESGELTSLCAVGLMDGKMFSASSIKDNVYGLTTIIGELTFTIQRLNNLKNE